MPTRDELVADWRDRLAEANATSSEASSRPAWLTRLRVRLYQFLLSLYGDGDWQGVDAVEQPDRAQKASELPSEQTTWQGKPAKDLAAIRSVLSSVAAARPAPNVAGILAEGRGPEAWVVIATLQCGIHPTRCASLLQARHVYARWINRNNDVTVEVRAKDETRACRIIQANVDRLRVFRRFVVPSRPLCGDYLVSAAFRFTLWLDRWSFALVTLFHFALVLPLAYAWADILSSTKAAEYSDLHLKGDLFDDYFWSSLRGLLILVTVITWLRLHWRSRRAYSKPGSIPVV